MTVDTDFVDVGWSAAMSRQIDHLEQLVQADPLAAIAAARDIVASNGRRRADMRAWSIIGRSLNELGDTARAAVAMRRSIEIGEVLAAAPRPTSQPGSEPSSGPSSELGLGPSPGPSAETSSPVMSQLSAIRVSAAAIMADSGDLASALDQLALAETESAVEMQARVLSQRAYILTNAGRLLEARRQADLAVASVDRRGAPLERLRILLIRSFVLLQIGELDRAAADLVTAGRLAAALGQTVTSALVIGNLGVVHARAGRTALAMQHFDRAHDIYTTAGRPLRTMAILETDRAEMLIRAGLFDDAVAAAQMAVNHATDSGSVVSRGDAELLMARAHLAAGNLESARRTAVAATGLLRSGHRAEMTLQARAIGIQAALAATTSEKEAARLFGRSSRLGSRLERAGWAEFSDDLRSARLRCAARLGILDAAVDDLEQLRRSVRSRRPAEALRAWHAEALARTRRGDDRAAMLAAKRGMQALERFRESTDDLQIRSGLSAIGDDLGALAVHLAVRTGSPSTVFGWAERTRAHAHGIAETGRSRQPRLSEVAAQLGRRTLVEFVIDDGEVWAVVVRARRSRLVHVGPAADIGRALDRMTAWLDRSVQPDSGGSRPAAASSAAARLAELLIAPLGLPRSGSVVMVPIGILHAAPWSALATPECPVVVDLSARAWLAADRRAEPAASIGAVVGPDVAGAPIERAALRGIGATVPVRSGRRATSGALRTMLETRDVVHIAAHGVFRSDRPLHSTLRLADGEMPIFDLNDVVVVSKLVVLSSCEAGVHAVNPGGEVLGLVGILLSRGADSVIAPVHTVPDVACAEFVAEFYATWSTGVSAVDALTAVRATWLQRPSIAHWATAAAFTCFGSGRATLSPAGAAEFSSVVAPSIAPS